MSKSISKARGRLTSAIDSSSTTISFTPTDSTRGLTSVEMADFGTYGYIVINPAGKADNFEVVRFASWSVNGSTITVGTLTRNLELEGADTEGTGRSFPAGTTVIVSDNHHWMNNVVLTEGNQTVAGVKTFSSFPVTPSSAPTSDYQTSNKKYVDDTAVAGAPDASTTVKGNVEIATAAEVAASTATGGTGAVLVVPASNCKTTTDGATDASKVPVLRSDGRLDGTFGGEAWGLATLNGDSLVKENPANATATPTASKIPIADGSGKLADGWLNNPLPSSANQYDLLQYDSGYEVTPLLDVLTNRILITGNIDLWATSLVSGTFTKTPIINTIETSSSGGGETAVAYFDLNDVLTTSKDFEFSFRAKVNSGANMRFGLAIDTTHLLNEQSSPINSIYVNFDSTTQVSLKTSNGSTEQSNSVSVTNAYHTYKVVKTSTSVKLYVDGVLGATNTTLPASTPRYFGVGSYDGLNDATANSLSFLSNYYYIQNL